MPPSRAPRAPRPAAPLLASLVALLLAAPLLAQGQATVRITEPAGWDPGPPHVAQAGALLHLAGVALDASGVRAVLVNGLPARVVQDPKTRGQVLFETDLRVGATAREVVVVALPNRGAAVERRLPLDVRAAAQPGVAAAPPSAAAAAPDTGTARQIPELPVIKVPPPQGSPWGGYALRGVLYAGAAGAGLYVASRKTVLHNEVCTGPAGRQDCVDRTQTLHNSLGTGLEIAGAAAAVAFIDALLTAHRAHARSNSASEPPPRARTGLEPPTVEPDARGARIALVRVRF